MAARATDWGREKCMQVLDRPPAYKQITSYEPALEVLPTLAGRRLHHPDKSLAQQA